MGTDTDNARRNFLLAAAGVPLIVSAPAPAVAAPAGSIDLVNYHLRELVKAIEAVDPTVNSWKISDFTAGSDRGCAIALAAWRE